MVTVKVRFLTNSLMAELTCKSDEIKKSLEEMGVLTPLSLIKLDNARTLQIYFQPQNETGELICNIINPKRDTLGNVQRLCRHIYCFNEQNRTEFISKLKSGEISSVTKGIRYAETLREQRYKDR